MKPFCVFFFVVIYSVSFSQNRDSVIFVHNDSSCFLKIPLQRADRWTEVHPVLTCSIHHLISDSTWLYDRWGREVYAGSGFEDLRKVTQKLSGADGDFTWRFRIEMEDTKSQRTFFECRAPLLILF